MNQNFAHSAAIRTQLIDEMLMEAGGRAKAQRAQKQAIFELKAYYEGGRKGEEPLIEDLDGMTWNMACLISSDVRHIFREERPAGVYGSEYDRGYVKARQEAQRKAARRRHAAQATGMDKLRAMLTI